MRKGERDEGWELARLTRSPARALTRAHDTLKLKNTALAKPRRMQQEKPNTDPLVVDATAVIIEPTAVVVVGHAQVTIVLRSMWIAKGVIQNSCSERASSLTFLFPASVGRGRAPPLRGREQVAL